MQLRERDVAPCPHCPNKIPTWPRAARCSYSSTRPRILRTSANPARRRGRRSLAMFKAEARHLKRTSPLVAQLTLQLAPVVLQGRVGDPRRIRRPVMYLRRSRPSSLYQSTIRLLRHSVTEMEILSMFKKPQSHPGSNTFFVSVRNANVIQTLLSHREACLTEYCRQQRHNPYSMPHGEHSEFFATLHPLACLRRSIGTTLAFEHGVDEARQLLETQSLPRPRYGFKE